VKAEVASNENRVIIVLCCSEILELDSFPKSVSAFAFGLIICLCQYPMRAYSLRKRKKIIVITDFKKYVKIISDRYENPTDLAFMLAWNPQPSTFTLHIRVL